MRKGSREIKGDLPGWRPVVVVSGRQTSETTMDWRVDWHPSIEKTMTEEEWKEFNQHIERMGALIEEASRRPPKAKGH